MTSICCILALISPALSLPDLTEVQLPALLGNSFGVPGVNATYGYVVVGGGTAGLTIAARLAQNNSVAVVEAGGFYQIDNGNGSTIPALCITQYVGADPSDTQPLIDWDSSPHLRKLQQTEACIMPGAKRLVSRLRGITWLLIVLLSKRWTAGPLRLEMTLMAGIMCFRTTR